MKIIEGMVTLTRLQNEAQNSPLHHRMRVKNIRNKIINIKDMPIEVYKYYKAVGSAITLLHHQEVLIVEMRKVLRANHATFQRYADHHKAKGATDKAEANQEMADNIKRTLDDVEKLHG